MKRRPLAAFSICGRTTGALLYATGTVARQESAASAKISGVAASLREIFRKIKGMQSVSHPE
jgi:hypothetical protein